MTEQEIEALRQAAAEAANPKNPDAVLNELSWRRGKGLSRRPPHRRYWQFNLVDTEDGVR